MSTILVKILKVIFTGTEKIQRSIASIILPLSYALSYNIILQNLSSLTCSIPL